MSRRYRFAVTAIVVSVASLTMAGCVNLPTSGAVNINKKSTSDLQVENQIGFVPRPPSSGWSPEQIVTGFLAASGDEAGYGGRFKVAYRYNVAYRYLDPKYDWHPDTSAPEVIDTGFKIQQITPDVRVTGQETNQPEVVVRSDHLETMVGPRLQAFPAGGHYQFTFILDTVDGQYRIKGITGPGTNDKVSNSILLLESSDFARDFQPRNLYFPVSSGAKVLVPYPVYISDTAPQLGAWTLVNDLLKLPQNGSNWLYNSVTTAFPRGTTLRSVQVGDNQAVIALGGKAAGVGYQRLQMMRAQIFWTLTHSPYSGTGITSVTLTVGNGPAAEMRQGEFSSWVPESPAATESLFYQALDQAGRPVLRRFMVGSTFGTRDAGATQSRHGPRFVSTKVVLSTALGRGPLTSFAISPTVPGVKSPQIFAGCRGKTVYVTEMLPGSPVQTNELPVNCTSLTWDTSGHLFVSAGATGVFEIAKTRPYPLPLEREPVLDISPQIPQDVTYASLSYAPDGVRVAIIVSDQGAGSVFVTSVHNQVNRFSKALSGQLLPLGPDIANPVAVAWLDSDHLLVLDRRHDGLELCDVPLDGEPSVRVPVPGNAVSVTSNGSIVAVGLAATRASGPQMLIWRLGPQGLDELPTQVGPGGTPAYPG